ncbi:hypothetical protein CRYUN_Cryun35bG0074200 [Craigia yunnanensis]
MLMGYATNGHGLEALMLFHEMRNAGVRPTDITFTEDYYIDPGIEHYSCMVNLFSCVGCLEEALNLIGQMAFKADVSLWSSVLRGCVDHGDKILGKKVAEQIIELDPLNSSAYVQLSSLFATLGEWETSAIFRRIMKEKLIQKNLGCSWVDN